MWPPHHHPAPRRDTARLIIRKVQFAPSQVGAGPKAEICKSFMMSDKPVHLEASMEKDVEYKLLWTSVSCKCIDRMTPLSDLGYTMSDSETSPRVIDDVTGEMGNK